MVGFYLKFRRSSDLLFSIAVTAMVFEGGDLAAAFIYQDAVFLRNLFQILFETSASLLGFVLASVTFLASHVRQPEFKILRDSKSYPDLMSLFSSALWRLAWLMVVSIAAAQIAPGFLKWASVAALFLSLHSLTAIFGLLWITLRILRVPSTAPGG